MLALFILPRVRRAREPKNREGLPVPARRERAGTGNVVLRKIREGAGTGNDFLIRPGTYREAGTRREPGMEFLYRPG